MKEPFEAFGIGKRSVTDGEIGEGTADEGHHGHALRFPQFGIVRVHKEPVPIELVTVMSSELTIVGSMGYPDEIFEVTKDLVANWEKYALIVSHTIPFTDVDEALRLASTPGAADKVVVTFS